LLDPFFPAIDYPPMTISENLRFAARVAAFTVNTIVCWACMEVAGLVMFRGKWIDRINAWVSRWARINLWIFGVQVEVHSPHQSEEGLYPSLGGNGVGRIFVANHSSGLDIPIILTVAEAHCISRHDVAHWPLLGRGARRVGTLFVDRQSRRSGASVLKEVDQALARGEGVAMFPEGTSYAGDEVHEFRNGAFKASRRAGAEIVPLGIAYGDDVAYYHNTPFMTHIKRFAVLKRLRVAVEIGEPLEAVDNSTIDAKDLARERVQQLVEQARARLET
jgi:1-acyl-sn-glycerol-3-phosphate acyltransferase